MDLPLMFLIAFSTMAIIRPILVLAHEFGHAFYGLKYTKEDVDIIIGDYTDEADSFTFKKGRLTIYVKKNPLYWLIGGCCICDDEEMNVNEYISYCLGGVAFEILFASIIGLPCLYFDIHGGIKLLAGFLLLLAAIDFFVNLYPREISKANFITIHSDGFLIWKAFKGENANREMMQKFTDYYKNRHRN